MSKFQHSNTTYVQEMYSIGGNRDQSRLEHLFKIIIIILNSQCIQSRETG